METRESALLIILVCQSEVMNFFYTANQAIEIHLRLAVTAKKTPTEPLLRLSIF